NDLFCQINASNANVHITDSSWLCENCQRTSHPVQGRGESNYLCKLGKLAGGFLSFEIWLIPLFPHLFPQRNKHNKRILAQHNKRTTAHRSTSKKATNLFLNGK
ncbi:hypothetical protein, partial [Amphritea pacifica]|uniref:hypothetical protein n=1 Tax=Amphritea pacifica TaxID=2811233 RepID=UPI0019668940